MVAYAEGTSVSVEKSLAEIKSTISRFGAEQFAYGERPDSAAIEFIARDRKIRFLLKLPDRKEKRFWFTPGKGLRRDDKTAYLEWEKACRQRWRSLALCVKAKLAAVNDGISTFEDEFMAHVVDPITGRTFGELLRPAITQRYLGIDHDAGGLLGLPAPEDHE